MEYIFGLTEGRRAIIYDEGNQIILLFVQRGRITNQIVLEREYHSELNAIVYDNKIYLAYMTVSYAIAWMELGGTGRVVLYANDMNMCHVTNLKTLIIREKLVLLYENELEDKKIWRLQYIFPLEDRKSYMLCEWNKSKSYQLSILGTKPILIEGSDSNLKYYYIEENDNQRYVLNEAKLMSVRDYEIQIQRKLQYEKEREELENEFKRQYNELVDFTKQLQDEGKYWREMYHRNAQNTPKNT